MILKNETRIQSVEKLIDKDLAYYEDSSDWKVEINTINESRIDIRITKIVRDCFVCSDSYPLSKLHIRQDDRVAKLFLPRFFCTKCVNPVDAVLNNLKPTVPKHLKDIRNSINNE